MHEQHEDERELNDIHSELLTLIPDYMEMELTEVMARIRDLVAKKDSRIWDLERQLKGL